MISVLPILSNVARKSHIDYKNDYKDYCDTGLQKEEKLYTFINLYFCIMMYHSYLMGSKTI